VTAYYNEIDPYAAEFLNNLICAGAIAPGDVDTRSIEDVRPDDLAGYTQCHFFAGLGGWSLALDLAGWPRDRPIWTGSCPCQPLSQAGKGLGFADERHLWPTWQYLIGECRPPVITGEQVASKAAADWIDLVHADVEGMGYAFGCVPFPAAGVGAPHIRDRNYWVADAYDTGLEGWRASAERTNERSSGPCGVAGWLADADGGTRGQGRSIDGRRDQGGNAQPWPGSGGDELSHSEQPGPANGRWRDADWIRCTDSRWRPVEPGSFPLAHGISGRVGRLRAYGNAIVPEAGAQFIRAYAEARGLTLEMA
jgi:DNA (cytosine-5)-methyltransferase 1